jgi:large subunit ribosomal protein L4
MDVKVTKFDGSEDGSIALSEEIFGLEPRADILQRAVRWQLAKRQAGTHKSKTRGEIAMTTAKMYKQKGTGRARHGAKSAPQFRGGGKAFGPVVRSHEHGLPKKVRTLALKLALSAKAKGDNLIVVSDVAVGAPKTKALKDQLGKLGLANVLVVGGETVDDNFRLAARNIPHLDVLPVQGINVYDILRREKLVLTRAAVDALEARLK